MEDIWKRVLGTAEAELRGPEPEELLERCRTAGLSLREVRLVDRCTLRVSLWQRDLEDLERLAAERDFSMTVLELHGGVRERGRWRRRIGLLLSLALVCLLLLTASLFVWQVKVIGCDSLSSGQVLRALAACGVEPGSFRPGIDTELVRSRVLTALPELEWLTVNISGSRAVVLVREREERPALLSERESAELRASRSGIVRETVILSGRSLVEAGDAVLEGELLVTGSVESIVGGERLEPALGEVRAETWYELSSVCPLEMLRIREKERTGTEIFVQLGKKRLNLWPSFGKGLDECDKIMHEYTLGMDGLFSTPLRLIWTTRHRSTETESFAAREEEMKAALLQGLEERIDGEILEYRFSVGESGDLLVVTLRARCLENIARDREQ